MTDVTHLVPLVPTHKLQGVSHVLPAELWLVRSPIAASVCRNTILILLELASRASLDAKLVPHPSRTLVSVANSEQYYQEGCVPVLPPTHTWHP